MATDDALTAPTAPAATRADVNADLGFGRVIAEESRTRFLNKDGSFSARRRGLSGLESLTPYYLMLTVPWWAFFTILTAAYVTANLVFAAIYDLLGPNALTGDPSVEGGRFLHAFFFSVHTLGTIGYGSITPATLAANVVVTAEAFIGLLGVALATGLLFSRFARPTARLLFSHDAIVAPFNGSTALMVRTANGLRNQLVNLEAQFILSRFETTNGRRIRKFHPLRLERDRVVFFPLAWTIVHPITPESPLWNVTDDELRASEAEILVLVSALDDTLYQTVHARTSYKADEVRWNRRFSDIYVHDVPGVVAIDVRRIHQHEPATPPAP